MTRFRIEIEALQPIQLGDRLDESGAHTKSKNTIDGQTLRGSLAARFLETMAETDPWFRRAIVAGELACSPLYPVTGPVCEGDTWGPLPATAMGCKQFAGFTSSDKSNRHGIFDSLLTQYPWPTENTGKPSSGGPVSLTRLHCLQKDKFGLCNAPMNRQKGFFHISELAGASLVCPKQTLITRSAVHPWIDSVRDGMLFSLRPFREGSRFAGILDCPEDLNTKPLEAIDQLFFGKAITRGFGMAKVNITRQTEPLFGGLADRVSAMRQHRNRFAEPEAKDETRISLDLWSPVILRDPWMRDRLEITGEDLHVFDSSLQWQVQPVVLDATWIGGWYGLMGLPKCHRQAIAAGSVLAVSIRGDRGQALAALDKLERFGLGEQIADGFGRVVVCHPFHCNYSQEEVFHGKQRQPA